MVEYETYETFNLPVPTSCPGVPSELLNPAKSWHGTASFRDEVTKLAKLFNENFEKYSSEATEEVINAGMSFLPPLLTWGSSTKMLRCAGPRIKTFCDRCGGTAKAE